MRGWLTPLGSEEAHTYWLRRALVVLVALLLVGAVAWGIAASARSRGGSSATTQAPAAQPTPAPAATAAPASATPSTPGAGASALPTPAATPAPSTPAPSTPAAPASSASPAGPQACDPAALRLTVTGAPRVKSGETETLTLSVINGGKAACILELSQAKYELKVTSGTDLIWTTAHCAGWVPTVSKTLKPEEAHEWATEWNTRRSKPDCQTTSDYLKPGTYVVRAAYGAKTSEGLVVALAG